MSNPVSKHKVDGCASCPFCTRGGPQVEAKTPWICNVPDKLEDVVPFVSESGIPQDLVPSGCPLTIATVTVSLRRKS